MATKTINVDYLARVEGEGGLHVTVRDGQIEDVKFSIFEPPRFFEAFLVGRAYREAPDITARICGICPVAHQMSSVHAMENAFGARVDGPLRELRRLLYCGEWIESHVLHMYMLHAPDFLGYEGAVEMAKDHPEIVRRGLEMKKVGNEIIRVLGGREIHPINVRVGGFYKAPTRRDLLALKDPIQRARDAAIQTVRWLASFNFPSLNREYEFVSLRHPDEYPMNEGRVVSNRGLDIPAGDYEEHFEEHHLAHSNALHGRLKSGGAYVVGPLARYALNFDHLPADVQAAAREAGLGSVCTNPYQSILVRAIEVLYAYVEALRVIEAYREPPVSAVDIQPRASRGFGATEAPRGMLYQSYQLDADGTILKATIVPPTSQNQPSIEDDLREVVSAGLAMPEDDLRHLCEQTIRNYDPCISCATHFLKLEVERIS
jgi:coenzyme F420-reducing hydrogenase alpha subunit